MSAKPSHLVPLVALTVLGLGACVEQDDLAPELGSTVEEVVTLGNQTITELCVEVSDKTNAGTTNAIELEYWTRTNDRWSCNLSSGASRGQEACCTPSHTQDGSGTVSNEYFYVEFGSSSSTDGLRVGGVSATSSSGTLIHYGTFSKNGNESYQEVSFDDCSTDQHCAAIWVDGDDHKGCWQVRLTLTEGGLAAPHCLN